MILGRGLTRPRRTPRGCAATPRKLSSVVMVVFKMKRRGDMGIENNMDNLGQLGLRSRANSPAKNAARLRGDPKKVVLGCHGCLQDEKAG